MHVCTVCRPRLKLDWNMCDPLRKRDENIFEDKNSRKNKKKKKKINLASGDEKFFLKNSNNNIGKH